MMHQRKIEEFESLLTDYSKDGAVIEGKIQLLKNDLGTTVAMTKMEHEKVEQLKEQIAQAEDRIKVYKSQRDTKDQVGEQLYNNLRDQISFQEERIKNTQDELIPLKASQVPDIEKERGELS